MQNQWYIARDGKQYGPMSDEELATLVRTRDLLDGDYLWRQGFENWLPAGQVPEVRGFANFAAGAPVMQPEQTIARDQQAALAHELSQQNAQQDPRHQTQQDPASKQDPAARQMAEGARTMAEGVHQRLGGMMNAAFNQGDGRAQNGDSRMNGEMRAPEDQRAQRSQGFSGQPGYAASDYSSAETDAAHRADRLQAHTQHNPETAYGTNQPERGEEQHHLPAHHALHEDDPSLDDRGEDIHDLVEDDDAALIDPYSAQVDASAQMDASYAGNAIVQEDYGRASDGFNGSLGGIGHRHGNDDLSSIEGGAFAAYGRNRPTASLETSEEASSAGRGRISWPLAAGIGIAALFILIVGATFALPFIVPPETIKRQISAALKEQTGRDVSFKGKMSYRFFPSFGLDLNNIIIHNPPEIKGPDFLSIGRLQADLSLFPLLSKRVEIERVALHRPEIVLINAGNGRTNYDFKTAAYQRLIPLSKGVRVAQAGTIDTGDIIARTLEKLEREEAEKNKAKNGGDQDTSDADLKPDNSANGPVVDEKIVKTSTGKGNDIQVGEVEIVNGLVKFIDQKANSETELSAINLTLTAPAADKDVTAVGTVRFKEDRINIDARLSTLGPLLEGEVFDSAIQMNSDRFEGKFTGKMKFGDRLQYKGDADIQTFSMKNLLNWFGVDVPKQGYGGAYIRGLLAGQTDEFTLKNATIKFDQTTLIGTLRLRQEATRPRLDAILSTDNLNLSPYLSQPNEIRRGALDNGRRTAVAAWSSDRLDVLFLNSFDGDVKLTAGRLIALGHPIEKGIVQVKVDSGLMTASIPSFQLYSGTGSLNVTLNGAQPRAGLKGRVALNKVNIKPLLVNAAGLDWISGNADVVFDVTSAGSSEREIIAGLNGTGKFTVLDGALEGVNIPGMVRNLQSGNLLASSGKPSEKTDFSELSATFNIERGIVSNKDLLMKGPLLRLSGEGTINLPTEQIDYGLKPKLVSSLDGQGGASDLSGINIPLRVKGPLANPKITPDAKGLLENNPEAIKNSVDNVKKVVKDLKKKKISSEEMKGLLNGMLGGDGDTKNLEKIFQ